MSANILGEPPNLRNTLASLLSVSSAHSYPSTTSIAQQLASRPVHYFGPIDVCRFTRQLLHIYALWRPDISSLQPHTRAQKIVEKVHELGWTAETIERLAPGYGLPIKEALRHCLASPPTNWASSIYTLVGRSDLAVQVGSSQEQLSIQAKDKNVKLASALCNAGCLSSFRSCRHLSIQAS